MDQAIDTFFARGFAPRVNPWRHLGALATWALAVTVASGVVTYALYDTSIDGAYQSGLRLQNDPSGLGAVLRGLHRYAADALLLVVALHLLRELLLGRFANDRALAWSTGVVLLPIALACAIGGFWLHWDRLGQFSDGLRSTSRSRGPGI